MAISRMADIMAERADSIYLEPPGEEGKGVEFRLLRDGVREYHQVKRQRGRGGNWTLSALNDEAVLTNFFEKLNDPEARCVFVSAEQGHSSLRVWGPMLERGSDITFLRNKFGHDAEAYVFR